MFSERFHPERSSESFLLRNTDKFVSNPNIFIHATDAGGRGEAPRGTDASLRQTNQTILSR